MKKLLFIAIVSLCAIHVSAGNKIKYYFNKPVDTTVSTGVNAVYLNNCVTDTIVAYINRAKYSIDICMYDFEKTFSYNISTPDTICAPKIAAAIDSAHAHGVEIRFIYEASNANTGLSLLDTPAIPTLGSPQGPGYTIMHNKFMVIDAKSPNNADPIVWTGCMNWYYEQLNWDYNNVVIFQDSALASAYTAEFNMMWGDTGLAPNSATSKFGQYKTNLGLHTFYIEGNLVELYFSPSDGTDAHIQATINSAQKDLYCGMYTFTEEDDAADIISKYRAGLTVYDINDSWSNGDYPTEHFTADLGTNFKIYNESADTIYHNKMLITDPSDTCADPKVLTGSHNWTSSANTENDENTVIIHNDTAANIYLQYFKASFDNLAGSVLAVPDYSCVTSAVPKVSMQSSFAVFPNPTTGTISINFQLPQPEDASVEVYNVSGQKLATLAANQYLAAGKHTLGYYFAAQGVYYVRAMVGNDVVTRAVIVE